MTLDGPVSADATALRVTLSAAFGGGAYYYAEQLDRRGCLHRWLSSRPEALRKRVDRAKVRVNVWPEVVARAIGRVPPLARRVSAGRLKAEMFDRWASALIDGSDVVVAFADFALTTLRRARRLGAVAIVERGSAHILDQIDIMAEEYGRCGLPVPTQDPRMLARRLAEYEEADYIAVPSVFAFETYLRRGIPADKLIRVPIGVDLERFRPVSRADRVFRILSVGPGVRKGTRYLMAAVERLALPGSEVVLAGGIDRDTERVLALYRGQYRATGKVGHADLHRVYSGASVLVVPSVEDGWGLVVNEAMACGIPVICSANTGAADMVRDGRDGFVVPVRDVDALADRIKHLYEHEDERRAMGDAARARVSEFTWDAYGQRIESEYRRVIARRRALQAV